MIKGTDSKIKGSITSLMPKISGNVVSDVPRIHGAVVPMRDIPIYDGVTDVVPNQLDLILETRRKIVKTDIVVRGVPYAEVENPSGGKTVTIGG